VGVGSVAAMLLVKGPLEGFEAFKVLEPALDKGFCQKGLRVGQSPWNGITQDEAASRSGLGREHTSTHVT
jgi:hypothetical protein